jgi:hypothetical protein
MKSVKGFVWLQSKGRVSNSCIGKVDWNVWFLVSRGVGERINDQVKHKVAEDIHNKRRVMVRLESGIL